MSIGAPPPGPGGPPPGPPPPDAGGPPDDDAGKSLHDRAVDASADIKAIAQGLAHAGASPQSVQALDAMAQTMDQIVKILAQAPDVEHAAKNGPAAGPQGPLAPPPEGPPHGNPGGLAPGAVGGPPPNGPFGPATAALHHAMTGGKPSVTRA